MNKMWLAGVALGAALAFSGLLGVWLLWGVVRSGRL